MNAGLVRHVPSKNIALASVGLNDYRACLDHLILLFKHALDNSVKTSTDVASQSAVALVEGKLE